MKNQELYNKTVDILVQAYLNDTLQHNNCAACAVGNIVAANKGITLERRNDVGWVMAKNGSSNNWFRAVQFGLTDEDALNEVWQTGYSVGDLTRVERAFENSPRGNNKDERMFNGLMAVIDVLDQIHSNTDAAISTAQKSRFNKAVTA